MIELPELVIWLIVKHLSHEDLQTLRVTCKKLKEILDQRPSRNLYLFVQAYPFERQLLHTGELISYANTFHVRETNILKLTKFKSHFTGLHKLSIYHMRSPPWNDYKIVNLNDLNCFEKLVHLELKGVAIESGSLKLKQLKIAFFENANPDTTFELDCALLEVLGLGWRTDPKLTRETSNSITNLYIRDGKDRPTALFLLYAKLRNLSTICFNSRFSGVECDDFVQAVIERRVQLPLLKKICIREAWNFPERGVLLRNLSNLKSRYETRHIEVQMNGKEMSLEDLAEILGLLSRISPDDSFYFGGLKGDLVRHFSQSPVLDCLLPGVRVLVLSKENFTAGKKLVGKLGSLNRLAIEDTGLDESFELDEEFFESFLKTCRRTRLAVNCEFLNQQQLDLVPNYLQNLRFLTFDRDAWKGNLNFDFVAKLKNLKTISFRFNIQKETMSFLFESCNYQNLQLIMHGTQNIWMFGKRNMNGRFEVIRGRQLNGNWADPENKVDEFDKIDDRIEHYYLHDLFNTPWNMPSQKAIEPQNSIVFCFIRLLQNLFSFFY